MTYPQTGSRLTVSQGNGNRTGVSLSTNIVIMVGNEPIGAVKNLSIQERRDIAMIKEVGTDGNIDSAPTRAATYSGSCDRVRFDRLRAMEALGRGFMHVGSQRVPFDIVIIDKSNGDAEKSIITQIKNVWISSISYAYDAENYIISDRFDWQAETIFSTLANGNAAGKGGERNRSAAIDVYEQQTDRGIRRGALDAPGLISAWLPF